MRKITVIVVFAAIAGWFVQGPARAQTPAKPPPSRLPTFRSI
jgi:hypothetical protein